MCVRVKVLGSQNYPCFCMGRCPIALTPFVPICLVYILLLWLHDVFLCDLLCAKWDTFVIAALTLSPSKVADFLSGAVSSLVPRSAKGNALIPAPLTNKWVKRHRHYL